MGSQTGENGGAYARSRAVISSTVMWFQRAVAAVSMRLAEPSLPTIWAPSSRPVWAFGGHLDGEALGAREVGRPGAGAHRDGHIAEVSVGGVALPQLGPDDLQPVVRNRSAAD